MYGNSDCTQPCAHCAALPRPGRGWPTLHRHLRRLSSGIWGRAAGATASDIACPTLSTGAPQPLTSSGAVAARGAAVKPVPTALDRASLHPAGATDLFGSTDEQRLVQAQQRLQRLQRRAAARLQAPPQQTPPPPPQSTSTPTPLPPPSPPSPPVQRRRIVRALAAPGAAADLALVRFVGLAPPEYTVNVLATSRARIGGAHGCGVRVRARARLPTLTGTGTLNTARSLTRSLARGLTRSLTRSLT
jgi:hypothetical protein